MLNANRTVVMVSSTYRSPSVVVEQPKAPKTHKRSTLIEKDEIWCPICKGKGERLDAKTHLLRPCVACKGTKKIKR